MIMLTCLSLIVGAALGQRLTVLVLIPATGCTVAVVTCFGMVSGLDLRQIVLMIAIAITGLQIGYLAGAAIWVATERYRLFRVPASVGDYAA